MVAHYEVLTKLVGEYTIPTESIWWQTSKFPAGDWTNPFEKYANVKLDHETQGIRGENNKKNWNHHLDNNGS